MRDRQIHKDFGPGFVDLKPLRMRLEMNIRDLRQADGIDPRERTLAVADQYPFASSVYAHIVGIVTELDAPDWVRSSARSTRTEPSPAAATNTLSEDGTYATPCGSLKPVILRSTLPAARSTTPRLLLPSSATSSRRRLRSMPSDQCGRSPAQAVSSPRVSEVGSPSAHLSRQARSGSPPEGSPTATRSALRD